MEPLPLSHAEISALQISRVTDGLVAEMLFDWRWMKWSNSGCFTPLAALVPPKCSGLTRWNYPESKAEPATRNDPRFSDAHGVPAVCDLPRYSQNLDEAWRIVNFLVAQGYKWDASMCAPFWSMHKNTPYFHAQKYRNGKMTHSWFSESDSLALSICRTALYTTLGPTFNANMDVIRYEDKPAGWKAPEVPETYHNQWSQIEDGFGSAWSAWCPTCKEKTMHIVRPGSAACYNCG
jgi:hypothetical protein